ncbi:MAG: CNNM domain-containing protein, partial [Dysgonamonadaceae bacterium]
MNSSIVMTLWIASLVLSVFFSGMEIAFISSDKLRYAMSKKNKSALDYILNVLYSHPRKFLTTLTIGNLMVLIVFVFCTIQLSNTYIFLNITESTTVALFLQFLTATV